MNNVMVTTDALEAIRQRKAMLRRQIRASKERMGEATHQLFAPVPKAANKAVGISQLVSNGMAIYEGLRLGMSAIHAFRGLFGRKKRR